MSVETKSTKITVNMPYLQCLSHLDGPLEDAWDNLSKKKEVISLADKNEFGLNHSSTFKE